MTRPKRGAADDALPDFMKAEAADAKDEPKDEPKDDAKDESTGDQD